MHYYYCFTNIKITAPKLCK